MEPRSIRTSKMQSLNSQHFLFFTVITLKSRTGVADALIRKHLKQFLKMI